MKKELLAPAGDVEAGYAALYYGADAVYLGLQQFSARATATNFNDESLNEFTGFAHSLKRKVFVAINTLVQESELSDLIKTLDICVRCQIDAVIIQDLGVARVVREQYPQLEMHASTQMAVHNREGALALQKMGFKRVVLARELTQLEIMEIATIPNLETEAFIHGALCYSYSGICQFSAFETGRSANRGKCLYPCRAEFDGESGKKHYFSMKDMALQEDVLKMPVTSLKIEGRKKTALYVAAVTDYYRKILDGKVADITKEENIKQIFSRPWCKFHFLGKNKEIIDQDFVGHRGLLIGKIERISNGRIIFKTSHDIERYDGLQIEVAGLEKPFGFSVQKMRVKSDFVFEAKKGEMVEIVLPSHAPALNKGQNIYLASSSIVKEAYPYEKPRSGAFKIGHEIIVTVVVKENLILAQVDDCQNIIEGIFTPATNVEKVTEAIEKAFAKTGETDFSLKSVEIENPKSLFVPISILNELRRGLYSQLVITPQVGTLPKTDLAYKANNPQWIIKTDDVSCLNEIDLEKVAEVVVIISPETTLEDLKNIPKNKLRLALPTICRRVNSYKKLVDSLWGQGYRKWEIANYWGLEMLPDNGVDLSFDAPLYMMNSQALQMSKDLKASRATVALEDTLGNLKKLVEVTPLPLTLVVYQDVPLFTSAGCIRNNACKVCNGAEKWLDLSKDGVKYQALSKNCQLMLFADKPLCLAEEARDLVVDFYRVDFCYKKYSAQRVRDIFYKILSFEDVKDCHKMNLGRHIKL